MSAPDDPVLEPIEVALLEALISEPTFARAAERIGRSERHARRLAARLVDRLDARNRYDAIAVATHLNLISRTTAADSPEKQPRNTQAADVSC